MTLATHIAVPYRGRYEESVREYLSSTDGVQGIKPAEIYEQDQLAGVTTLQLMAASQSVLARDWDRPEEDEAWAYLSKGK